MRLGRATPLKETTGTAGTADFDELFRSVWPRAVTSARRITGPGGDPEAIAAEALTRAFDRWPSVRRHPAPDAWVLRVTINLALDRVRSARRRGEDVVIDLRDSAVAEGRAGIVESDDTAALRLALVAAMAALPTKQRNAVALRYLAGCGEDTIAASLGIGAGTVKTHLKRGLSRLRDELGQDPEATFVLAPHH